MDNLTLFNSTPILVVLLDLAAWGIVYARRITKHPMLRTYASVIYGIAVPLVAMTLTTGYTLWLLVCLSDLWGILFIPWFAIGIPAAPMIYLQEMKHREQLNG